MLSKDGDGVGCGSLSSTRTVAALKARAPRRQSRRGRCSGVGEVGTWGWTARRGVGGSARLTGHFKVNGVGTLWLPGNDEVMAKEVDDVMIVWELWHGTVT